MSDYFVRYIPLPITVQGATLPNDDGTFSIYINARLPFETQKHALAHEIQHIRDDHLYSTLPVPEIEKQAEKRYV